MKDLEKNLECNQEGRGVQLEEEAIGFGDCFAIPVPFCSQLLMHVRMHHGIEAKVNRW